MSSNNAINLEFKGSFAQRFIKNNYLIVEQLLGFRQSRFLLTLDYWIKKCGRKYDDFLWIFNTTKEWARQLNCSISTIKRTIYFLEENKIIFSKKFNAKNGNQTKFYSINYKKLAMLCFTNNETKNKQKLSGYKWSIPMVQKESIIVSNRKNNYTKESSLKKKKNSNESTCCNECE